jgi:hypothetical protein
MDHSLMRLRLDVTLPGHLALELSERSIHRAAGDHLAQRSVHRLPLGLGATHLHGALDEALIENDVRATHRALHDWIHLIF